MRTIRLGQIVRYQMLDWMVVQTYDDCLRDMCTIKRDNFLYCVAISTLARSYTRA